MLGIATGNFYLWSGNRASHLEHVRHLGLSCVEITIDTKENLYGFELTKSQIHWLRSLDYVSIHSPFRLIRSAANQKEVFLQLDCVEKLYKLAHARNTVIEARDLPAKEVLDSFSMHVSTENPPKATGLNAEMLGKILRKRTDVGLCVDVSHAYTWSWKETERLVNLFSNRISQVHFSGTCRYKKHVQLSEVSRQFLKSIECVRDLQVPIIVEEVFQKQALLPVKRELALIRDFLGFAANI